jgi:thiaminase/transcriptional activator TenA
VIFKEATRLEADFWEMGWRAGQRVEYGYIDFASS